MLITLNQYTTHHILQTRTDITRNANHTKAAPEGCAGAMSTAIKPPKKQISTPMPSPKSTMDKASNQKVYTGNKQEEAESHHIHQTENQCRNITATTEKTYRR